MRKVFECNGKGLPDFPEPGSKKVACVKIWMHDSGLVATHNYSCPVCLDRHAVFHLNTGIMQPCHECESKGYKVVRDKPPPRLQNKRRGKSWLQRWWKQMITDPLTSHINE